MKVLTVYAHYDPRSLCHAVLERFTEGLAEAGHQNEVVDLYAIGFNPVLDDRDAPNWMDENIPQEILDRGHLKQRLIEDAGGPLRRWLTKRWIAGKKDERAIIRELRRSRRPKDVAEQQDKLSRAQALVLISPVWFVGFPAILKGWIERVFTLGFAFDLAPQGWRGDIGGRIPRLTLDKALVINTTLFDERAYADGLGDAMRLLIDEFALRYPGIKQVEHEFFYAVYGADDATRRGYLERAYRLGKEFAMTRPAVATEGAPRPAEATRGSRASYEDAGHHL